MYTGLDFGGKKEGDEEKRKRERERRRRRRKKKKETKKKRKKKKKKRKKKREREREKRKKKEVATSFSIYSVFFGVYTAYITSHLFGYFLLAYSFDVNDFFVTGRLASCLILTKYVIA